MSEHTFKDEFRNKKAELIENDRKLRELQAQIAAGNDPRIVVNDPNFSSGSVSSTRTYSDGSTSTVTISSDGTATLNNEQQNNLQRASNDPSLIEGLLEENQNELNRVDKKIAQDEGTFDYNGINPFTGGTDNPNTSPSVKIKYPYNWVQATSAGHMFEMNNTEDGEYIRLLNANGNFLNIDEKKNNNLVSYNDTYILSDHNLVIRVGKDVNNDRMALHIVGDVNLYVEGNMHSEVEGDRFDRVNGNYQMQVGGVATIQSDENLAIQAKNEMKLQSNAYTNKTVFLENDLSEGGSIKENVRGNYEVKILKSSAAYSVVSNGDIRSRASGCRYEYTFGNHLSKVIGKLRMRVDGASQSCIKGGGFPGMFDEPDNATYRLNVGGNIDIDASGIVDIDGTEIYLN